MYPYSCLVCTYRYLSLFIPDVRSQICPQIIKTPYEKKQERLYKCSAEDTKSAIHILKLIFQWPKREATEHKISGGRLQSKRRHERRTQFGWNMEKWGRYYGNGIWRKVLWNKSRVEIGTGTSIPSQNLEPNFSSSCYDLALEYSLRLHVLSYLYLHVVQHRPALV